MRTSRRDEMERRALHAVSAAHGATMAVLFIVATAALFRAQTNLLLGVVTGGVVVLTAL